MRGIRRDSSDPAEPTVLFATEWVAEHSSQPGRLCGTKRVNGMSNAPPNEFDNAEPVMPHKPRIRVALVAHLAGLKPRTITDLASKEKIPGAAKHGGIWTFDQDNIALWLKKGNQCQKTSTSPKAAKSITSASRSTEKNSAKRFTQLLSGSPKKKPGRVSKS